MERKQPKLLMLSTVTFAGALLQWVASLFMDCLKGNNGRGEKALSVIN